MSISKRCKICGSDDVKDLWVLDFFGILCTLHALNALEHWTGNKVGEAVKTISDRQVSKVFICMILS